jgi:hypothetical protein
MLPDVGRAALVAKAVGRRRARSDPQLDSADAFLLSACDCDVRRAFAGCWRALPCCGLMARAQPLESRSVGFKKAAWIGSILVGLPAVVLLVLAWVAPYPHIPFYRDSSTYAYLGLELLHGHLPIRDFWDQKPGAIAWVDAAAFLFAAPNQWTLFWLDIVFSFGVVAAAAWAVSGLTGRLPTAVVLVWGVLFYRLPNVFEGGNLTEQYALIPAFVGLGAGVRALAGPPERRMRWAVLAGLSAGVAALFKPTAGTAAPALVVAMVVALVQSRNRGYLRAALACAASAIGVVVLALAAYLAVGTSPGDLYADLIVYNAKYPPPLGLATLEAAVQSLSLHRALLQIPLAAVLLRLFADIWGRRLTPVAMLVVTAMAMDVAALIAPGFFYGHYYMLLIPSFTVGFAWAIGGLVPLAARLMPLGGMRWLTASLVVTVVLGLLLLINFPLRSLVHQNGFLALASGSPIPLVDGATVQAVERICRPHQPIYVWGSEPEIYVESGHPSSSRYMYISPLQMPGYDNARRMAQLISDLEANPPCAVIDASSTYPAPPLDDTERASWHVPDDHRLAFLGLDPLYQYINSHFIYEESAGAYRILVPRTA